MSRYATDDPREEQLVWRFDPDGEEELDRDATPQGSQEWYDWLPYSDQCDIVSAAWDAALDDAGVSHWDVRSSRLERLGLI